MTIKIGNKVLGDNNPVYIIGEIGINHNGDLNIAKKLIDVAVSAGCDAVKFQKRNPDVCVPEHQKQVKRETPWGYITYLEYKYKVEFGQNDYDEIDKYCQKREIDWFVSCWDIDSVDFISQYNLPALKVASASITEIELLKRIREEKIPVILSSGMSTLEETTNAVNIFKGIPLSLMHCVSTYPAPLHELNLNVIKTFKELFPEVILGYSGHEVGLAPTYAAVVLGAKIIERHITLDRSMWGTDQSASIEPNGLRILVDNIRDIETSLGDGIKVVSEGEKLIRDKLRNS